MGHIIQCDCKDLNSENVNLSESDDLRNGTRILTPIIKRHNRSSRNQSMDTTFNSTISHQKKLSFYESL